MQTQFGRRRRTGYSAGTRYLDDPGHHWDQEDSIVLFSNRSRSIFPFACAFDDNHSKISHALRRTPRGTRIDLVTLDRGSTKAKSSFPSWLYFPSIFQLAKHRAIWGLDMTIEFRFRNLIALVQRQYLRRITASLLVNVRAIDVVWLAVEWPVSGEIDFDFAILARELNGLIGLQFIGSIHFFI